MIATAPVARPSGRGRQPAAVERSRDVELELIAERQEGLAFVGHALFVVKVLGDAMALGRWDLVDQARNELGYRATRRQRQLGSVIL